MDTHNTFLPLLVAALKALEKEQKIDPEELSIGTHPIDGTLTIKLKGTLELAADQHYEEKAKVNWPLVLALLLQGTHGPRADAKARIEKVLAKALAMVEIPKARSLPDRMRDASDAIDQARKNAARIPASRAGPTKFSGESTVERTA